MTEAIADALRDPRALFGSIGERLDLVLLSLLLAAGAVTGGGFGALELHGNNLRLTEIGLLIVALLSVARLGIGRALHLLGTRAAPWWLGTLALAGLIGALRGFDDVGLKAIIYDVQFFEFIAVVPIVVLVADTPARLRSLGGTMFAIVVAATLLFALSELIARATDATPFLADQEGETATGGFFGCILVGCVIARYLHGDRLTRAEFVLLGISLVMIGLTDKRTAWLAFMGVLAVLVVLAPWPRRITVALACAGIVLAAAALTYGIEKVSDPPPDPNAVTVGGVAPETTSEPGVSREIGGVFGGDSAEADNVQWRLAFWGELLDRTISSPTNLAIGAGFGPERFEWHGNRYDFREPASADPSNTSGPHSAFVGIVYATGLLGLIGLLGLLATAAAAVVARIRDSAGPAPVMTVAAGMTLIVGVSYAALSESLRAPELASFIWAAVGIALLQKPGTFEEDAQP
jgi:O-antigen ligase